jgi:dipeptidyl aminopeptidase/acylaminoacyl peptidase
MTMRTALLVLATASPALAAGRPITPNDLLAMQRISEPQLSPDGTQVVYTVGVPDLKANRVARNIWIVPVKGGEARALTTTGKDGGARWSPDGTRIAFISSRDGGPQLYVMTVGGAGGEARRLTNLSGGADNIVWAPSGRAIAITSEVYPDCRDEACNAKRDKAREENPVHARVYDRLLYRHWTSWSEGKRVHPFIVSLDDAMRGSAAPHDLIPGADYDAPPREREGAHPMAFAPDSQTICFIAITDPVEAASTNADLFEVPVAGGAPKRLTTNPGFDGAPAYSPDGRSIAYHSQARAGYESDKWRLMIYDRASGKSTSLTDAFDRSVDNPIWSSDSRSIYFNAEDRGELPVFMISATGGSPRALTTGTYDGEFDVRGDRLVVARSGIASPVELDSLTVSSSKAEPLTHDNAKLLAQLDLQQPESFTFRNAGAEVQGFLLRPPAFDASKKYPVLMLLHGGPETMWGDTWSYRWNAETFAAQGWVIVMINRRGSTGFGQKFTDEIANDWGGKAFTDLMTGLDFVLGKYPFTNRDQVAAAGGSYGGYMIDWMESQAKGRFRALVSHAGVFDLASMYGATEELWFPEHEFSGTPWANAPTYEKLSPSNYVLEFGKYRTPTLVIAGEQDFRVPYTQSLEFYTALQRQGVPSRLLLFPDEGHWILKPENSLFWYREVLGWLREHFLQS